MAVAYTLGTGSPPRSSSSWIGRWAMKKRLMTNLAVFALAMASAFCLNAQAQTTEDGPGPSEQPDAPFEIGQSQGTDQPAAPSGDQAAQADQGVARVSMIHGDVSTQRGDSGDWSAATLNAPVVSGDKISTGDNARAEMQLDYANILRVGG